jgi:hypothetical protein
MAKELLGCYTLVRDGLKLTWRIDEFLSDSVGKLDRCNNVAYAETKAHCDFDLLVLRGGEWWWRGCYTYAKELIACA